MSREDEQRTQDLGSVAAGDVQGSEPSRETQATAGRTSEQASAAAAAGEASAQADRTSSEARAAELRAEVAHTDARRAEEETAQAHEGVEEARKAEEEREQRAREAAQRAEQAEAEAARAREQAGAAGGLREDLADRAPAAGSLASGAVASSGPGGGSFFAQLMAKPREQQETWERTEVLAGGAFAAAFLLARILKAIAD